MENLQPYECGACGAIDASPETISRKLCLICGLTADEVRQMVTDLIAQSQAAERARQAELAA